MNIAPPREALSAGAVEILAARDHICQKRWKAVHAVAQPLDCCRRMADRVLDRHDWRRRGLADHAHVDFRIWLAASGRGRDRPAVRLDYQGHGGVAPSKARQYRLGDFAPV